MKITTNNQAWGFFGTTIENEGASEAEAAADFDQAACELVSLYGLTDEQARDVLDSRTGRHLADDRRPGELAADLVHRVAQQWPRMFPRTIRELAREQAGA